MSEITRVYQNELLGPSSKRHFESIQRQMDRYEKRGQGFQAGAEEVLKEVARREPVEKAELQAIWTGITGESLQFSPMLEIMQDDFYLKESEDGIAFSSELLRNWWMRHQLAGQA